MIIRKIDEKDLPDLNELYEELCETRGDLAFMQKTFKLIDSNPAYHLLGAEVDGKIVGTLMGIVCHDLIVVYKAFMTIENVIVSKDYRGRGIARALFDAIEEIAHQNNCGLTCLISSDTRKEAHQMYRHFGYDSDHCLGFRKPLN